MNIDRCSEEYRDLVRLTNLKFPSAIVHFIELLPRGKQTENDNIKRLNQRLRQVCENLKCCFVKSNYVFQNDEGTIDNSLYQGDGTHLNCSKGTAKLASLLKDVLSLHVTSGRPLSVLSSHPYPMNNPTPARTHVRQPRWSPIHNINLPKPPSSNLFQLPPFPFYPPPTCMPSQLPPPHNWYHTYKRNST
ncbi:hypothetical protein SNE40_001186 [Patella caerulea]